MRERLGRFEVVRLLGKGAMGEVYLGRDPRLGREVALKVIAAGSDFGAEAQVRFEREARAAALPPEWALEEAEQRASSARAMTPFSTPSATTSSGLTF